MNSVPLLQAVDLLYAMLVEKCPVFAGIDKAWVVLGAMAAAGFALTQFVAAVGGIMTYLERRIAARIQYRVGPNRVGPQGLLQFLADGIKMIFKEDLIPDAADKPLFRLAPYLVVVGSFLAFVALPFTSSIVLSDLNVGILYVFAVSSFVVIGVVMSGWGSNSKWALLGALRSAAQIISYEIPAGMAALTVVLLSGSLGLQSIIKSQGFWPWEWHVFSNPFAFLSVFIFFTAALAENNRTPFDLPEAESELVSGFATEYSGMRFGLFFMAEFANVYLISALCTILFLGGWNLPFAVESFWMRTILELGVFWFKVGSLVFLVLQLRWTLPRLRIDQLMTTCWKYLVPVAFLNLIGTAIWMFIWPHGNRWVSFALFFVALYVLVLYVKGIVGNLKAMSGKLTFNPLS